MRRAAIFALVLGCTPILACDKDKPKQEEKKSDPTPVPSGLVFNDFIPSGGAGGAGLHARGDAGLEGGLAEVQGGPADDPAGAGAGGGPEGHAAPPGKMTVTEPGAEPRAVRKYTFVANKTEKRLLTMQQQITQSAGGQTQPPQAITIKIALDITAKQVKPTGATMEAKVTKIDLPGAPPQAAAVFAPMNGMAGTFEVSSRGEAGEIQFQATAAMKGQGAEIVVQSISQAAELLVLPFPDAPVGTGAKWEIPPNPQRPDQGMKRFTLKEVSADSAAVDLDVEVKVPKRATQGPRGGTMFVEIEGKGKHVYAIKFGGVSSKVDGETGMAEKIEVPDPRSGQRQQVMQIQKSKMTLETVK